MTSLTKVLIEILEAREFEVKERGGFLHANKAESEVVFLPVSPEEGKDVSALIDSLRSFKGRKVVAALRPLSDAEADAIDSSILIWDREAIEREIGRTRIEKVVGEKDHGLVDELLADDYPRIVTPDDLEKVQTAEVGERIVRPNIDLKDVREISRKTVGGFRYRLELVPYYVFRFSCDLYINTRRLGVEEGHVSVNALTRKVGKWDEAVDIVYSLDQSYRRLEPMIDSEEAKGLAKEEVVRIYSYDREVIRDSGQVTVVEKKKVSPRQEDVEVEDKGLYYAPIWCVEGIHGVMIVDAGTGKIISEDYYKL